MNGNFNTVNSFYSLKDIVLSVTIIKTVNFLLNILIKNVIDANIKKSKKHLFIKI